LNEQLTALDATFLELEEADQCAHMHIGSVMVFEPSEAPSIALIAGDLEAKLDPLPRYRQRLSEPRTGGLSWPAWEDSPNFDVRTHIRRASLPAPGGEDELREWAGAYFSERLDRSRPLWELVILEGFADGRWALANKTHHCMVDGVGSVDASSMLFDLEPSADVGRPKPGAGSPIPPPAVPAEMSKLDAVTGGIGGIARLPIRAVRAGLGMVGAGLGLARHPRQGIDALKRSRAMVEVIIEDELSAAPRSSVNVPISAHRRLALVAVPVDDLKAIKNSLGGTLNDVILAVSTGGLRALLMARGGAPPETGLRAMVPVNVRADSDRLALGNKVSSLFVELPVAEPDPLRRYQLQRKAAERHKSSGQATGTSTLMDFTGHAPPVLHSFIARSMYATRLFNVTITNVPGPQMKIYAFGSEVEQIWPIVPLAAEHAIGIAILSYAGNFYICANVDPDAVPDLDVLRDGIEDSIAELAELAG
jgi:diacylglycerol O-acyltransferase / wax synthase